MITVFLGAVVVIGLGVIGYRSALRRGPMAPAHEAVVNASPDARLTGDAMATWGDDCSDGGDGGSD